MPSTFSLGGLVPIEDPAISGVFPTRSDFDVERMLGHEYVTHKFGLKKEQRILTRKGGNGWRVNFKALQQAPLATLYTFYDAHRRPEQLFYFYDPYEAGGAIDLTGASTTGRYVCRFKDNDLDFQALLDRVFSGSLELIEVNTSTTVQSIGADLDFEITPSRYPRDTSGGGFVLAVWLKADLTGAMDMVPLVTIMPKQAGQANYIHVSDRLCNITQISFGSPTELHGNYLPRLLSWEFSQQLGEGDEATFVMDNADQVWDEYANQMDLGRAIISLNFQTGNTLGGQYTLKLWRGYIVDWASDRTQGTFTIKCEGGIHALNQKLPRRTATTTCPLVFNFGPQCPYATQGAGGDPASCDKGLDTANGCTAHGMTNYFQGVVVKPITAKGLLPRNAESVWSFSRKAYTTTSTPLKGIQDTVIPLVYGDGRQIVEGKIFEFRDESEFKVASGIVSDGPVGEIGSMLLDGQAHHFVPGQANPGIRALGALGQNVGTIIDPAFRSSALAFVSMRVNDEIGIKSAAENHTLLVEVLRGLQCLHTWFWTGSLDNHAFVNTSNPIIIAHDLLARAVGASPYAFESIQNTRGFRLDMWRYTDAVAWCETLVAKLGGAGTEKRFEFRGVIQEQKPAMEWLRDVAGTAPVDIVYTYGNVAFKLRKDDITTPQPGQITFEHGQNIIQGSFRARRWEPAFNELKLLFADEEIDFKENDQTLYSEAAQKRIGFYDDLNWNIAQASKRPLVKQRQLNLTGCFRRSQAVRLGTQLLWEECGGATEAEQLNARVVELEASLLGLAVEIGDVSRIVHPDLPGGQAFVRWEWFAFSDWTVKLRGRTVTASMYSLSGSGAPPQLPTSQSGEVMDFPVLAALTPPVLTMVSCSYAAAVVSVSARPDLVNYLLFQSAANASFSGAVEQVLPATMPSVTVAGTAGVSQFFRAKWRRTLNPLEESGWSNTVTCAFPKVAAADIASVPENVCVAPLVPKIQATYGWAEFIEVSLLLGAHVEGVKAVYAGPLTSGAWPKGGLFVENLSSDATVGIEYVDFMMGSNPDHAAGFVSLDSELLDPAPLPLGRGTIAAGTNITTLDTADPGSPKRGIDYLQTFLGAAASRWVQYVLIPRTVGDPFNLVCPQDSIDYAQNVPPAYHCDGGQGSSYFGVRLNLTQFSAQARGVAVPRIEVAIYGRSGGAYSETLQRTFYDPFLPSHPFAGHDGSFYGNLAPAAPPARIRVKFSTGFILDQAAVDVPNQGAGIHVLPTAGSYELEDYFVFISETAFSNTLAHPSGDWWEALEDGVLPAGVHLAQIARASNFMVSNLFGAPLVEGQTYRIRVGARRSIEVCPGITGYLYSETLSDDAVQAIQVTSGTTGEETPPTSGPAPIVSASGQQLTLIEGSGITLLTNTTNGTLSVALDMDVIRESSGFLFGVPGAAAVGTNVSWEITADFDGSFKDWALRVTVAPTGSSLIIDIHKNGTSIFANGATRPTLTAGSTSATGTVFDLPAFVKGDVFRLDIDQIGSTVPGTRPQIQLNFDSPLRLL